MQMQYTRAPGSLMKIIDINVNRAAPTYRVSDFLRLAVFIDHEFGVMHVVPIDDSAFLSV